MSACCYVWVWRGAASIPEVVAEILSVSAGGPKAAGEWSTGSLMPSRDPSWKNRECLSLRHRHRPFTCNSLKSLQKSFLSWSYSTFLRGSVCPRPIRRTDEVQTKNCDKSHRRRKERSAQDECHLFTTTAAYVVGHTNTPAKTHA